MPPRFEHMELDERSKPRKLTREDTKIMQLELDQAMANMLTSDLEDQSLPITFMQHVAIDFYEVTPEKVTEVKLLTNHASEDA